MEQNSENVHRTNGQLLGFVERIESVDRDIENCKEDRKEIFKELEGSGFEATIIREVLKIRKEDRDKRHERDEKVSLYLRELGMAE